MHRGLMVSALDSRLNDLGSSLSQGTALCCWAIHFTLTVPLSTTQVNKWVQVNLLASHPGGSRNTPSHFKLQKLG